jgi:hypothetical protein
MGFPWVSRGLAGCSDFAKERELWQINVGRVGTSKGGRGCEFVQPRSTRL